MIVTRTVAMIVTIAAAAPLTLGAAGCGSGTHGADPKASLPGGADAD